MAFETATFCSDPWIFSKVINFSKLRYTILCYTPTEDWLEGAIKSKLSRVDRVDNRYCEDEKCIAYRENKQIQQS